ncbi:ATP-binding protein [Actinoallomurus spadix]|uniref:Histidine kinase/HSP90-like ATPase domain-containing protein n=1 Tax=Actinoallomurus spadix TaxID=79912 RepID=A0ABN0VVM8_9ACTN|nr:ATP-binding protein [Actinoallomurus spadix]MCO5985824.1 ATP-binding protein [Actinoallomurus spadix]
MTPDPAVIADRAAPTVVTPVMPTSPRRPSWIALRAEPASVAKGRRFARDVVGGYTLDDDYLYLVRLLVSELLTNAVNAARAMRDWPYDSWPVRLDVAATNRWVYVAATDPDHRPLPAAAVGGLEAENGRGLHIIDGAATARWPIYREHGKTIHVVVAAPGVTLTADELRRIGVPT